MTDRELDEIMTLWWPRVLRRAMAGGDAWLKSFTRSIAKAGKRPSWHPSGPQAYHMRRLVDELHSAPTPELQLIEEE